MRREDDEKLPLQAKLGDIERLKDEINLLRRLLDLLEKLRDAETPH